MKGSSSSQSAHGQSPHLHGKLSLVGGVHLHVGLGALLSGISHQRLVDGIAQFVDFFEILIHEGSLVCEHVDNGLRGLLTLLHGQ